MSIRPKIIDLMDNEAPVPEPVDPITPAPMPPVVGERCQWRTVDPWTQCTGTAELKNAEWCADHRCSMKGCTQARVVGTVCVGHQHGSLRMAREARAKESAS